MQTKQLLSAVPRPGPQLMVVFRKKCTHEEMYTCLYRIRSTHIIHFTYTVLVSYDRIDWGLLWLQHRDQAKLSISAKMYSMYAYVGKYGEIVGDWD